MTVVRIAVKRPSEPRPIMRITKAQAAENRERVLDAATRLFRERGFDGVGVADLMREAGFTHGAFYNHFGSKTALEAAACRRAFDRSVDTIAGVAAIADPAERAATFARFVDNYLSQASRDAAGARCAMVAFAADVARQSDEVKQAFAPSLRAYAERFAVAAGMPGDREAALARLATLVGALVLARSVAEADPALSDEFLQAGRAAAKR